jgi:hypothetical protein
VLPDAVPELPVRFCAAVKLSFAGEPATVKKTPGLVPPGVVTRTNPLEAPPGTVAIICVGDATLNVAAARPLKVTLVAPLRPLPEIATTVPGDPLDGLTPLAIGGATTVKLAALIAVPAAVVIRRGPVEAPAGTVAVI